MGITQKLGELSESVRVWLLAGLPVATAETIESRLNTCKTCEKVENNKDGEPYKCKECNCYLHVKSMMDTSKCPLNKW